MLPVLSLALVSFALAAPPIVPPVNLQPCVDGVNNVVKVQDIHDGPIAIHARDMVAQTYDVNGNPSCYYGRAAVSLPGQIKLVKGTVVVSSANTDMKSAEFKMTLKKNSVFIGTVCENGVPKKAQVPPQACHHKIYPEIGDKFLQMLSTPGSYDMETIEKEAHQSNIIKLPAISSALNTFVVKGDWQAQIALVLGGQTIAHIKAPSNTEWLYVN
uniref:Parasitic stage specific protein 1 n=1 Tax=Teladorsagia circumcincta TaxID=45464 RepID=E0YDN9_TELCI|nr:parasitic stage specific protein 1 [Teladorsagia circumcincta]